MIKIAYSPAFVKAYKRQIKNQIKTQLLFSEKVALFLQDPYHTQIKRQNKDFYSFSIDYDVRVIFYFASDKEVIFENIGSHDEVY